MVPGRLQSLVELSYEFIGNMVGSTVGKEGRRYFPFIFTLFMFILFGNALGMIPGSFTYTSHIVVTFTMAIFVVTAVTIIGIVRHGWHFFSFFAPSGRPIYVMPLLVPIEVLSYPDPADQPVGAPVRQHDGRPHHAEDLRGLHHGARRLLRGAGDRAARADHGPDRAELAIAFLQAYVFTVLTCIYLQDSIHLH